MTDSERLEILRNCGFQGMDLQLLSKIKRPEYYGITFVNEAKACLGEVGDSRNESQVQRIIDYCNRVGSITSLEATNYLHIMSFTKRMSEISRDPNYEVTRKWESNGHTKWMRYEIKERKDEH